MRTSEPENSTPWRMLPSQIIVLVVPASFDPSRGTEFLAML
jgi:hypothetical protein